MSTATGSGTIPSGANAAFPTLFIYFITDLQSRSKEVGLVPLFLFSDVAGGGGGTFLAKKSHLDVAEW